MAFGRKIDQGDTRPPEGHKSKIGWMLRIIAWFSPLIFILFGYFVLPETRTSVLDTIFSIDAWNNIALSLLIIVFLSFLWIIYNFIWLDDRETTANELMAVSIISILWTTVICTFTGTLVFTQTGVQWYALVPALFTLGDCLMSVKVSINNAAQKPWFGRRGTL